MSKRVFALLAVLCIALGCLAGCNNNPAQPTTEPVEVTTTENTVNIDHIDYAAMAKLDMGSETVKQELTVKDIKAFVDGDTTHFFVPTSVSENGVLKARYLAVNTPESTGKIEEWGKKASAFTKGRLSGASEIVLESDNTQWNLDSTGGRHLVWVWYKPEGSDTFRNLNIELLQEGLSIASNSADNRYGTICMDAINQAKAEKLHMHSKQKDPDFYYGEAIPVTLKGLRTNIELYEGLRVAFEGVITHEAPQTVYVEEYDEETGLYFGMTVYYGYNLTGTGLEILKAGNRVTIIGSVQYYATAGTWQVSDIKYVDMRPNDPNNIQLISEGHTPAFSTCKPAEFIGGSVTVDVLTSLEDDETVEKNFPYAKMRLNSSISMENLKVTRIYTTDKEDSASKGAMTLTCQAGGVTISVRTVVLRDENGDLITADAYEGKTINVKGIVDYYNGGYQIKVLSADDITVVG